MFSPKSPSSPCARAYASAGAPHGECEKSLQRTMPSAFEAAHEETTADARSAGTPPRRRARFTRHNAARRCTAAGAALFAASGHGRPSRAAPIDLDAAAGSAATTATIVAASRMPGRAASSFPTRTRGSFAAIGQCPPRRRRESKVECVVAPTAVDPPFRLTSQSVWNNARRVKYPSWRPRPQWCSTWWSMGISCVSRVPPMRGGRFGTAASRRRVDGSSSCSRKRLGGVTLKFRGSRFRRWRPIHHVVQRTHGHSFDEVPAGRLPLRRPAGAIERREMNLMPGRPRAAALRSTRAA
jgi:hypothetical protein